MHVIQAEIIYSFRDQIEYDEKDDIIFHKINSLFLTSKKTNKKNKKIYKTNYKKKTNFQEKVNSLETKVNITLNKLTKENYETILTSFFTDIPLLEEEKVLQITNHIWKKNLREGSFIDIYMKLIIDIENILQRSYNGVSILFHLINNIEMKYNTDYYDQSYPIINELLLLPSDMTSDEKDNYNLTYKNNNLKMIHWLISNKILSKKLEKTIIKVLSIDKKFGEQFYFWMSLYKPFNSNLENIINVAIKNNKYDFRIETLLKSLTTKIIKKHSSENINKKIIKTNIIDNNNNEKYQNLIREYLFIGNLPDLKLYIQTECKTPNMKNEFCKNLYYIWFEPNHDMNFTVKQLITSLLKSRVIYKSNLSRGLKKMYQNWESIKIDSPNAYIIIKDILEQLKFNKITKGIEYIFINHQIIKSI